MIKRERNVSDVPDRSPTVASAPLVILVSHDAAAPAYKSSLEAAIAELRWTAKQVADADLPVRARADRAQIVVIDDVDLCERVRAASDAAIAFVAADHEELALRAFAAGADDVIDPTTSGSLVAARLRALTRRRIERRRDTLDLGEIVVDSISSTVYRAGLRVALTPIEYRLLLELAYHRGHARTREQLVHNVWGQTWLIRSSRQVDIQIVGLRAKLGEHLIETVRGFGYRISAGQIEPSRVWWTQIIPSASLKTLTSESHASEEAEPRTAWKNSPRAQARSERRAGASVR